MPSICSLACFPLWLAAYCQFGLLLLLFFIVCGALQSRRANSCGGRMKPVFGDDKVGSLQGVQSASLVDGPETPGDPES